MTVYLRLGMGLGNQMFQYAAGRSLAAARGCELVIDLAMFGGEASYGGDTPRKYELGELFGIDQRIATDQERSAFSYSQPVRRAWNKAVYRRRPLLQGHPYEQPWPVTQTFRLYDRVRPAHTRSTYFEPHFHFDRNFFSATQDPVYLIGYWQSWRYAQPIIDEIRRELTVRPPLVDGAAPLARAMRDGNSVAVHVRLTDRVAKQRYTKLYGVLGTDYYRRALETLHRLHGDLDIYVFSDDPDGAVRALPAAKSVTLVSGDLTTTAAEDLFLMTQCRHNVIANSSFSWWGAHLGATGGTVVAPRRWYATRRYDTRDLYPADWVTATK